MKKIKIMLISLLVFALAGGALAFKVKFDVEMCTTLPRQAGPAFFCTNNVGAPLICGNVALNRTITTQGIPVCTTPIPLSGECSGVVCPNLTFTVFD